MKVIIKRIYDSKKKEIGANISAIFGKPTTNKEKIEIERKLIDLAFDTLYPRQGLVIYRDIYVDSPAITVITNINDLPSEEIEI